MLVLIVLGLMFSRLKTFSILALISRFAFSPSTRILGKPNALAKFRSTSLYPGPGNTLRSIPGAGMKWLVDCPALSVIAALKLGMLK